MSGFSADWLTLREPFDRAARNGDVLAATAAFCNRRAMVRLVDIACGTGSTLRTLGPHIKAMQHWTLADHDLGLLGRAAATPLPAGTTLRTVPIDLNLDLEAALDGAVDIVTTSALLDLVSGPWLERFATEIAVREIPLYAALSYDGRIALTPSDPLDERVIAAVNAHQRTDKGFGPALGPHAGEAAIRNFRALRYDVVSGPSDWNIGSDDTAFLTALLNGWAQAAREIMPDGAAVDDWLARRLAAAASRQMSATVGHVDFFARPMAMR